MPTFDSTAALKAEILNRSEKAVASAKQRVYEKIDEFLHGYYSDYTPEEYIRTKQLLRSLVQTKVKSIGNGWEAEVYFDASKLNYKKGVMPLQHTPEHGRYGWATWGADEVLSTALHGSHGGYVRTAPIYGRSLNFLNSHAINILVDSLHAAGVPVVK